jgi:C-terminal processing protease CtpA/Prc
MNFYFTGMRVTRHDGSPLHLQGFKPDIEVVPTAEGLRAGRDEVLERAVKLLETGTKRQVTPGGERNPATGAPFQRKLRGPRTAGSCAMCGAAQTTSTT